MQYYDAHLHLAELPLNDTLAFCTENAYRCCTSTHLQKEWEQTRNIIEELAKIGVQNAIQQAFGIHPIMLNTDALPFLETLLQKDEIHAIGEIGLDFYTPELQQTENKQREIWQTQLELAIQYKKPIVIHSRRSLDKIFTYCTQLKKIPAVIFHSWPGSPTEAKSFLARGVNAYFSIGKQVLNGNKRAIASAIEIPLERLLLETDAPYQTLKNQATTPISDIKNVYQKVFELRTPTSLNQSFEEFAAIIANNS